MAVPHWVDTLNSLLKGEQSAVETYGQLVSKLGPEDRPGAAPVG